MVAQDTGILVIIGMMIIAASAIAIIARKLKQPLIFGYVLAGVLLGPAATGIISDPGPIIWLSELALIFLMFVIGLELDVNKVREAGRVSIIVGTLQVGIMLVTGAIVGRLFGFSVVESIYLGLLASFSSTILVAKLLQDRHETRSLVGELAMGVLITEDILAVFALALLGTLHGTSFAMGLPFPLLLNGQLATILSIIIGGALFALLTYVFYKFILPRLFKMVIGSKELLFVTALAVVFLISGLAGFFKFSLAIGSFAAGIAISSNAYSHEIVSRVNPIKDFFLTLFFVLLGLQVTFSGFVRNEYVVFGFLFVGVLILKPVVTFFLFKLFKYNNYTAFLTAAHLNQLSEFSLILVASGVIAGILSATFLTAAVIVTILTMLISTYILKYDQELYHTMRPLLDPLDQLFGTHPEEFRNVPDKYLPEIVIFGITPVTAEIIEMLKEDKRMLVVDFNPARAVTYEKHGIPTICSDAIDIELYESIDFSKAETIVSVIHDTADTLHGPSSNTFLIKKIRDVNKRAVIIVTAQAEAEGERFYKAGATIVLTPSIMGKRVLKELLAEQDVAKLRGMGLIFYEELHDELPYKEDLDSV